jgi:hypothetical protein
MTALATAAPRKLPVWSTVGGCYATVAHDIGQLVRISWLWLLLMVPVYAAAHWLVSFDWALTAPDWAWMAPRWVREIAPVMPLVVELPFLASIAVAWHRLVLRHERVSARAYLRLDRPVWLYAMCALGFLVLTIGPFLPVVALGAATQYSYGLQGLHTELLLVILLALGALSLGVSLFVLPRLSLVLPALALGERLSLSKAWRITRGNTLRFALATYLCMLPALLLLMPLPLLSLVLSGPGWLNQLLDSLGYIVFNSLAYAVLTIFAVTLLSLTYRFFVVPGEGAAPPA